MRPFGVVLLCTCLVAPGSAQRPDQAPGTIRSGVTVVPLDVRVLDRQGNPVTDLRRDDFTVIEDGVQQTVGHFSTHGLTADAALANAGPLRPGLAPAGIEPVNRRVFLLMLGRGRHDDVTKSIRALEAFVSDRLLPQDQVALLAWNRATDFTTDHELVRQTIRRYRERHTKIETGMREWFSGLRAQYGSREIPPFIQQQIDAVFADAKALRPREVRPGQITDERGVQQVLRRNSDALLTKMIADGRADSAMIQDLAAENLAELVGMDFEDYVQQSVETLQDVGALYAGLEYLRFLDGEKHLVLFTAAGLRLPRAEDSTALARVAANARITINTIHTGGTVGAPPPRFLPGGGVSMSSMPTAAQVAGQGFSVRDLRHIAEMTGGRAAAFIYGDVALDRIDRASRFQYLLGYTPANGSTDGRFRKIEVKVNRPGVTVLYRQGYFASRQPVGLDRARMKAGWRILSAAQFDRPIPDLKITLSPPELTTTAPESRLILQVRVAISELEFLPENALHKAQLEMAVFAADERQKLLQEFWEPITLRLSDDARDRYLADGASLRLDLPAPKGVRYIKVVVYDPGSDLVGSAVARLR